MDLEQKSKELRQKLGSNKKNESEEVTKNRMKKVLSARDEVMKEIFDYQDRTGIPTKQETEKNFFEFEINQQD